MSDKDQAMALAERVGELAASSAMSWQEVFGVVIGAAGLLDAAAREWDRLRAELDEGRAKRAEAAVSAVLALHWARGRDYPFQSGDLVCMGCATKVTFTSWPCATVRAIDAAFFGDKQ